jgi:hypothetical protein
MPDMYMVVSENQHSATVSTNLERRARFNDLYAYCHPLECAYLELSCRRVVVEVVVPGAAVPGANGYERRRFQPARIDGCGSTGSHDGYWRINDAVTVAGPPVGQTVPATGQETVIPASVRELASATVPGYGQVQFWGAPTTQGGFCFAIKLPDGSWGGYPLSLHPRGGWVGGSIPGCTSTQEHQVITEPAVPAGQHLTNADDGLADNGDLIGPTPVEQWRQQVKSSNGKLWNLSIGYVEVQGTAATVRDPGSGATAPVTTNGYYLLVEPSGGGEGGDLKVLDVAGEQLPPDYTYGGLLPGYAPGPTKG